MSRPRFLPYIAMAVGLLLALHATACDSGGSDLDALYGMDGAMSPTPPPGKADGPTRRGLWVNTNTRRTQVWDAVNRWEDTDTPAARAPGLAWGRDSGLTWDQKYAAWIQSLERIQGEDGQDTYLLTTPWGKTVPSPALECAEMSIFLRVTFAAWYQLPFFMEAVDQHGTRVFFGHNGVRTAAGRYAGTPEYGVAYRDYSSMSPDQYSASWPHDQELRSRHLGGGSDSQPMLGDDNLPFGAYVDEIHLNKRVGYFLMLALNYLGSANLADSANTYNLVPEAVRPGDSLLERWQRVGIGHTLVVKDVTPIDDGTLDAALVSGSMPRRQGKWVSGIQAKGYFTSDETGGEGENYEGDAYAQLGGGLKRWRVTKNIGGYWTNTWMQADEAAWINSTDYARIAARPARFAQLLGQVSPEAMRDGLLATIADARDHLHQYPASCAARERRERAFEQLYDLMSREFDLGKAEVDRRYRDPDDYIFAQLEYGRSKTCCWDQSTAAMYQIIVDYAAQEKARADADEVCRPPTVFMNQDDGYDRWLQFAMETGRADAWRPWTEDESCAQRDVAQDTETEHHGTDYCTWRAGQDGGDGDGGGGDTCTDAREPNEQQDGAPSLDPGSEAGLAICDGDSDWFAVPAGGTVRIEFDSSAGDLDLLAAGPDGAEVARSQGVGDSEEVTVPAGGAARVYGYLGATNQYSLSLE